MVRRYALKIDEPGQQTLYIGKEYRLYYSIPEWVDGWMNWRYARDYMQKDKADRMLRFGPECKPRTYTIIELDKIKPA